MPTYDYKCEACSGQFEIFHSMSTVVANCPECGKPNMVKLISCGAAVIVKGTETPCRGGRPKTKPQKSEKPFWRDGPVNKKVLDNPDKYILEGETS